MSQKIILNQNIKNIGVGYLLVSSNTSGIIVLNGSNTMNSANNSGELIGDIYLAEAIWSNKNENSSWTISRGANTSFVFYGKNGNIDFIENQMRLEYGGDSKQNLEFTLSGTGNLILKLKKNIGELISELPKTYVNFIPVNSDLLITADGDIFNVIEE